jgi:cytochrome c-type biogenesis protein CcmF
MAAAFLLLPFGPLLAWKRGHAAGAARRRQSPARLAAAGGLAALALISPRRALASLGLAFGVWVICGALEEAAGRLKLLRAPLVESGRRLASLPRGAWGMTLAHIGLGLFAMGAAYETGWRVEAAQVLRPGDSMSLGVYSLKLDGVAVRPGPNYDADEAQIVIADGAGHLVCDARPARRTYDVGGETLSKVALCPTTLSDLYVVVGERRVAGQGSAWLVRAFINPWIRLVFLGPLLMALGGVFSLSDRRLRLAVGRRAAAPVLAPAE